MAAALPALCAALASKDVSTIFDKGPPDAPQQQAPVVEKPTEMPTPNDAAVAAAKRKSIAGLVARQGRASTILTDQSSGGTALGA